MNQDKFWQNSALKAWRMNNDEGKIDYLPEIKEMEQTDNEATTKIWYQPFQLL